MSLECVKRRAGIRSSTKLCLILLSEFFKNCESSFLLCPPLLEAALVLAMSGSKSNTTKEILEVIHLSSYKLNEIEDILKIQQSTRNASQQYSIKFTHQLYINKDFTIRPEFTNMAREKYEADVQSIDFTKSLYTGQIVNKWIKKNSNDIISDLLETSDINNLTDSLLVSVASFKGSWETPFLISETKRGVFTKLNYEVIEVEIMNSYGKLYNYYDNPSLQAKFIELPFLGEDASMIIVTPYKSAGLATLEKKIDKVVASCAGLCSELVNISLPKFKIISKHLCKNILQNVGLVSVFRDDEADFSGIAGEQGELVISEIIQCVSIAVNEDGIGATADECILISVPQRNRSHCKRPKSFSVDHPFIFFIKVQKIIFYAGRILEPEQ